MSAAVRSTGRRRTTGRRPAPPSAWTARWTRPRPTWLDDHLGGCAPCRSRRGGLRGRPPRAARPARPPARSPARPVGAHLGRASSRRPPAPARRATGPRRRSPLAQWTAVAGFAVIALVIGSSRPPGWLVRRPGRDHARSRWIRGRCEHPAGRDRWPVVPGATPIAVGAGIGRLGRMSADGVLPTTSRTSTQVCPADRSRTARPSTTAVEAVQVTLASAPSRSHVAVRNQAVVVGTDGSGGDARLRGRAPGDPTPRRRAVPTVDADRRRRPDAVATPERRSEPPIHRTSRIRRPEPDAHAGGDAAERRR